MTQRKGGDSCDSSDLQRYLQDLELKGIFSTGLGKVIDESRSKNLRAPSSCIPVLHVALTALSKSESRRKDSQQDEQVHAGEMVLPPTLLAEVRKQETPLGSQELSHQGRPAGLEKDILEMLWCLTYFIRQPFVEHWSIYKHEL